MKSNRISLLGKKNGGSRCVAVCATIYRLLLALLRPILREWDKAVGNETDSALAGKSPLLETGKRAMILERASILGKTTVLVLWDVEKFFDSLQLDRTIQAAIDLDFPSEILVLGLQVHKAPRLIKACGTLASMIQTTDRSIIAGCTISTSLSRAYLRPA